MVRAWLGSKSAARTRRGMTLIEILVVVAIIATLSAILFPVFLSATESARQTKCLSNLHNIGSAFVLYLNDWDDSMPSATGGAHFVLLNRYLKAPVPLNVHHPVSRTVWECPSMPGNFHTKFYLNKWPSGIVWPWHDQEMFVHNSYLVNSDACMDVVEDRTRKLAEIRTASRLVLMTEACYEGMHENYSYLVPYKVQPTQAPLDVVGWCKHVNPGSSSLVHPYHNMGANFLYCDMHTTWLSYVPPQEQWDQNYFPRNPER